MHQEEDFTILSRRELYELVWATPKAQLAKQLDTSPTCVRRACDTHSIPWPEKTYLMTAKRWGTVPPPPPLPAIDGPSSDEVRLLRRHLLVGNWPATLQKRQVSESKTRPKSIPPATQPIELSGLHTLVARAGQHLQRVKPDERGWLLADRSVCLDIRVTRTSLARALAVYDAFIRAWEAAGGTVSLGTWWFDSKPKTLVEFDGDRLPLYLREDVDRVEKTRDPTRKWARREYDHLPNGKLAFTTETYYGLSERGRWADGKAQRLEAIIDDLVSGLQSLLATRRAGRLERECIERQKARVAAVRKSLAAERDAEERRAKSLLSEVDAWYRASRIRQYLTEKQEKIESGALPVADEEKQRRWAGWAAWYADSIDPLVATPQHPDRPKPPSNIGVAEMDLTSGARELVAKLGLTDADSLFRVEYEAVESLSDRSSGSDWEEICRVLEALGYDVARNY